MKLFRLKTNSRSFKTKIKFDGGSLIDLNSVSKIQNQEATLYIKGFLQKNEKPEDFNNWKQQHLILSRNSTHSWNPK
jgi:hypothetical protein